MIPTCFGIGIKGDDTKNDTKFIKKIYKLFKTKYYDRKSKSDLRCSNDGGFIG